MRTVDGVTSAEVAGRFVVVLRRWLTKEQWAEMQKRNAAETDPLICHSHDFCDANMAMDEAFKNLGLDHEKLWGEDWAANEEAAEFWNEAWSLAMPSLSGKAKVAA